MGLASGMMHLVQLDHHPTHARQTLMPAAGWRRPSTMLENLGRELTRTGMTRRMDAEPWALEVSVLPERWQDETPTATLVAPPS